MSKKDFFLQFKKYSDDKMPYQHKGHLFFIDKKYKQKQIKAIKRVCKNE